MQETPDDVTGHPSVEPVGTSRRRVLAGASVAAAAAAVAVTAGPASATPPAISWPGAPRRPKNLRDIVDWDAAVLSVAIRRRVVSCVEVMNAYLDHIEAINPQVNAIVSLRPRTDLVAEAKIKDGLLRKGQYQGWMHGFPHAVKDLADVKGIKTSYGFLRPEWGVPAPTKDSLFVARIRDAGAIFIGKTNTPEFGLGSQTYNSVFGTTLNAYDQTRTSGGSSGGAAVAVALRMVPVADGSDFMGSLRNPPGWNNVYGIRTSFGRIAAGGSEVFIDQGGVNGPIARTAQDLALLLRTMSGYSDVAPLSIRQDPAPLADVTDTRLRGRKVAWLGDLGGYLPMEPEVLSVTSAALKTFSKIGMSVTSLDGLPTTSGFDVRKDLWSTWLTYRHWLAGMSIKGIYDDPALKAAMKPEGVYEVEGLIGDVDGGPISAVDVYTNSEKRTALYATFRTMFETYDYVVLSTAQLFPFDASTHWPRTVNGVAMSSYHRWMEVTTLGTLINAPTLAMPAGFSSKGLPIGLQVIGRNHDDFSLMDLAHAWETHGHQASDRPPALLTTTKR